MSKSRQMKWAIVECMSETRKTHITFVGKPGTDLRNHLVDGTD
jgi:hypothetical protein